jgi:hypothetical protein
MEVSGIGKGVKKLEPVKKEETSLSFLDRKFENFPINKRAQNLQVAEAQEKFKSKLRPMKKF